MGDRFFMTSYEPIIDFLCTAHVLVPCSRFGPVSRAASHVVDGPVDDHHCC